MLRIKYGIIMGFLTLCLVAHAQGQEPFYEPKRTLLLLGPQDEILPYLPVTFEYSSGEVRKIDATTNEKGEITVPEKVAVIKGFWRISLPQEFGTIIGDGIITDSLKIIRISSFINQINPVSITTSAKPRLLTDNPYSIQVINRKTIQQMAAQNLNDVLQNQSGIVISQDPNLGASMRLQGLGGQNVKILINGIPMIGRLNGSIDISQIPTEQIDRVEIIEGPMSVVYGTDAIGGVINIVTKTPHMAQRAFYGKMYADQNGYINHDLGFSRYQKIRKKESQFWGIDLNLGRQFFNGFDFDTSTRSLDWKPKTRLFGDIQGRYKGKQWEHRLRYSQFYEFLIDRSDAEFNLTNITGYNNYFHTSRKEMSAISQWKINPKHTLLFQNAFNVFEREKIHVRRNLVTGSEVVTRPVDQDTTFNTAINFRGLWEYDHGKGIWNSLLGYEFQNEQLTTLRIRNLVPIRDVALFGSLEFKPAPWVNIKPSLRMAINNTFGSEHALKIFGETYRLVPLIPSLQIKSNISEHFILRGSYARGFRAPNAKELYFLFVDINHNVQGNPALNPEHSHNFNASLDYRHSINAATAATFKVSSFYNHIYNQIQLGLVNAQTNLYQYVNIGILESKGMSAQTQLLVRSWDLQMSYSYLANESQFNLESNQRSWALQQGSFNLSYHWKKHGGTFNLFSRYTGKATGFTTLGTTYELPSFWLSDINYGQKFWQQKIHIQLGVKNLFNVTQLQHNSGIVSGIHQNAGGLNIAMGRNIFIQCTLNL
jgi:outer membrane receptor for ferrienterochelin and colicins